MTLQEAIDHAEEVAKRLENSCCWCILRLHSKSFKLKTAYGCISNELKVSQELAERILKVIEDYTHELETELENM